MPRPTLKATKRGSLLGQLSLAGAGEGLRQEIGDEVHIRTPTSKNKIRNLNSQTEITHTCSRAPQNKLAGMRCSKASRQNIKSLFEESVEAHERAGGKGSARKVIKPVPKS